MTHILADFRVFSSNRNDTLRFPQKSLVWTTEHITKKDIPMTRISKGALAEWLQRIDVVRLEPVDLRGGEVSNVYYDIKKAYGDPYVFPMLIEHMEELLPPETTCVAASGHGGIPIASAIAIRRRLKLSIVRDKLKDHGPQKLIDGHLPQIEDAVVIIDDVLTTGSSIRHTYDALLATGARHVSALVVLQRNDAVSLPILFQKLFTVQDFAFDRILPAP